MTNTKLLIRLMERCQGVCEGCGRPPDFRGLAPHHKVFRSHGGKDTLENLEVLCGRCHSSRHGIKEVALEM